MCLFARIRLNPIQIQKDPNNWNEGIPTKYVLAQLLLPAFRSPLSKILKAFKWVHHSAITPYSVSQIQMLTDEQFLQRIPQYGLLYLLKECSERDNLSSLRIVSYWNRCIAWAGYILIGVAKI